MMTQSRKYILHNRHEWLGETQIHWSRANRSTRTNTFLISDIGDCLVLKLRGFVDEQQARIQEVSENQVTLQLGGSPWRAFLFGGECPIDLKLEFRRTISDRNPQSKVEITIQDRRWRGDTSHFETAARRVILQLQQHFMANYDDTNKAVAQR